LARRAKGVSLAGKPQSSRNRNMIHGHQGTLKPGGLAVVQAVAGHYNKLGRQRLPMAWAGLGTARHPRRPKGRRRLQLFRSIRQFRQAPSAGTSATVGVFDGVHRGHQLLLDRAGEHARRLGLPSLAVTFANHPLSLLAPPYAPPLLTTAEEKAALLAEHGMDFCLMLDFDAALAAMSPEAFLGEILAGACHARHVTCGRDFRFGAGGRGSVETLRQAGPALGFEVEACADLTDGHGPIRSSRVRALLLDGEMEQARRLLGRSYALGGTVVAGDRRGRDLGFPTANLEPSAGRLVPGDGVYAAHAEVEGQRDQRLDAMVNIGARPTFDGSRRIVEAHLIDFTGDLYGRTLTLHFLKRIRDERRFESAEALIAQLRADREACLAACREAAPGA
jgi:riboflavin kinase/FMN adenylyltransferase